MNHRIYEVVEVTRIFFMTQSNRRLTAAIIPPTPTFEVKPWRDLMPKANADVKSKEMKAAEKKLAAKGVTAPRHRVLTSKEPKLAPASAFPENPYSATGRVPSKPEFQELPHKGLDTDPGGMVYSEHVAQGGSAFTQLTGALMNAPTESKPGTDGVAKAAELKAEKQALKDKKAAEAAEKKAKADADKKAKAEALAKKKADADAEKAAKAKAREEAKANRQPRDPNAVMAQLGERTKAGLYVKGANGQLRSNDDVAVALESIPAKKMVAFLLKFLGLETNPYAALNYGQQSMNLRNKLRGVLKAGVRVVTPGVKAVAEKKDEAGNVTQPAVAAVAPVTVPVTLDLLKAARDEGNWTRDEEAEAKAAAKAKKEEAEKEPATA